MGMVRNNLASLHGALMFTKMMNWLGRLYGHRVDPHTAALKPRRHISIAKDFSPAPGGRTHLDGPYSGQAFREKLLMPALRDPTMIVRVSFDGCYGLAGSFLDEAFGGLRVEGFDQPYLQEHLEIISHDPIWAPAQLLAWGYIAGKFPGGGSA